MYPKSNRFNENKQQMKSFLKKICEYNKNNNFFNSMVPELSRSADHLCHGEEQQNFENNNDEDSGDYSKGPFLKTPDYANRG